MRYKHVQFKCIHCGAIGAGVKGSKFRCHECKSKAPMKECGQQFRCQNGGSMATADDFLTLLNKRKPLIDNPTFVIEITIERGKELEPGVWLEDKFTMTEKKTSRNVIYDTPLEECDVEK